MNSSRKRSIITPRPYAAALIQASYNASRPLSSRRMKYRSKNQFSALLTEQIDEQLTRCSNDIEKHQIYRDAFATIIDKYSNYSDSMNAIKKGYESLIDGFLGEIEENEQKTDKFHKSQSRLKNLLDLQKQELEEKKLYYEELSVQLEEQIQLLTNEVDELSKNLAESKASLKDEDYFIRQKWAALNEYNEKSEKKEIKAKRIIDDYNKLKENKANLKLSIENHQIIISKTLDDILNKKRSIKNSSNHITSLQEEIEKETIIVEKKRERFKELEERNKSLNESISNYDNEIRKMNQENIDITNYLTSTLKSNKNEEIETNDPVRLTERFVTLIRPKRTVIDVGT